MKVTMGGPSKTGIGLGSVVLVGLLGLAALAVLSASDIRRYLKIRSM